MDELIAKLLEGKRKQRTALAALPFSEKVAILEQLRGRSLLIAESSPFRKKRASTPSPQ
jgi:hypothetical protein